MLAELAPGRAFTAPQHFQSEDIRVELDGFLSIGNLDDDMIAAIHLNGHDLTFC
jgi:hypothetical protein